MGSVPWRITISMEMSHHGFCKIFRIDFSLLYRYTHGAWKRKMHSFALIYMYIQGCKCRGGVKCRLECELMRGPLPWVLFCMCDSSYVTWKYRQYRRYHVIFARKYKTLQNVNIPGARINSSGTPLFTWITQDYFRKSPKVAFTEYRDCSFKKKCSCY